MAVFSLHCVYTQPHATADLVSLSVPLPRRYATALSPADIATLIDASFCRLISPCPQAPTHVPSTPSPSRTRAVAESSLGPTVSTKASVSSSKSARHEV